MKKKCESLSRPSSVGQPTPNFAATPDVSRGKFIRAYNPPTFKKHSRKQNLAFK